MIQHCIEEALMFRDDQQTLREQQEQHKRSAVKGAQDRAQQALERLRRG